MLRVIYEDFREGYDEEPEDGLSIEGWNDSGLRTRADVLEMLDTCIARY
jgi:hypothetical protein